MSKDGAVKIMDPPPKALPERMLAMEALADVKDTGKQAIAEAREMSLRTRETVTRWWRALPNDGVRAAVAAGVGLVLGMIAVLLMVYRRRIAPVVGKENATRP